MVYNLLSDTILSISVITSSIITAIAITCFISFREFIRLERSMRSVYKSISLIGK